MFDARSAPRPVRCRPRRSRARADVRPGRSRPHPNRSTCRRRPCRARRGRRPPRRAVPCACAARTRRPRRRYAARRTRPSRRSPRGAHLPLGAATITSRSSGDEAASSSIRASSSAKTQPARAQPGDDRMTRKRMRWPRLLEEVLLDSPMVVARPVRRARYCRAARSAILSAEKEGRHDRRERFPASDQRGGRTGSGRAGCRSRRSLRFSRSRNWSPSRSRALSARDARCGGASS